MTGAVPRFAASATNLGDALRVHDITSVCVVGNGYVGTVVAASLSSIGHSVVGLETDATKLAALRSGRASFHEPSLDEMLERGLQRGSLTFTDDIEQAVLSAKIVFLCVGSPSQADGSVDLRPLVSAVLAIARWLGSDHVLVIKTTVPVGTNTRLRALVKLITGLDSDQAPSVISNPEFLRQGSAVQDFLHPDRIVLGGDNERALDAVAHLYRPILEQRFAGGECRRPRLVRTTSAAAEAAKYAANAFLAAKVSFINEVANICDRVGADIADVARIVGLDHRVGPDFLQSGLGWGGSCFTKDLDALIIAAREAGYVPQLLEATRAVNQRQLDTVINKLQRYLSLFGARVALFGLAFKPGTDDLRGAPALRLARSLQLRGAAVAAFDPVIRTVPDMPSVSVTNDPYMAADAADAVVLVTDWPELRRLDLVELRNRMRGRVLVDGRNALDPHEAALAGFAYEGIGRGRVLEPSEDASARSFRRIEEGDFATSADEDDLDASAHASRTAGRNGHSPTERSSWDATHEPRTVASLRAP